MVGGDFDAKRVAEEGWLNGEDNKRFSNESEHKKKDNKGGEMLEKV